MTGLRIVTRHRAGTFQLISTQPVGYGDQSLALVEAFVPFGTFTSRPDPVRRAWLAVEAKRGFRRLQDTPAPPPARTGATRSVATAPAYTPAVPRLAVRAEKRSQGIFGRLLDTLAWVIYG